jgi:uncharacterized coiled-coil protein SlyX
MNSTSTKSTSTWTQMMDAFQSDRRDGAASNRQLNTRLLVGAVAALLIVAGAFVWRVTAAPPPAQVASQIVSPAPPVKNPVLDELVEATKALEASQQQAIDQLQALQELLTTQQAEARKSSSQVAALNAKLEALQQSFASIPAVPAEEAAPPSRSKAKPAAARSRGNAHRIASSRKTRVAAKRH